IYINFYALYLAVNETPYLVRADPKIKPGHIALNSQQRQQWRASLNQAIDLSHFVFYPESLVASSVGLEIDVVKASDRKKAFTLDAVSLSAHLGSILKNQILSQ
ncbi:hypothetical protein KIPB_015806, partial [Kipferlia bialata]